MTFKEYLASESDDLSEQAIAMANDWEDGIESLGSQGEMGMRKYKFITSISKKEISRLSEDDIFEFYQLRNSLEFKLGYWSSETIKTKLGFEEQKIFVEIFKIQLTRYKSVEHKLGYKRLVNVDGVAIIKSYVNKKISLFIYKYLVNELNYTILGDEHQYFGARKLWARLSKELDVKVDIIDIKKKEIIEKNVILHHGNYDEDFDKRIWVHQNDPKLKDKIDLQNIRTVLTKIL